MFIDEATIHVSAGKGGDGRMNFLRNRHQPKGGPDGGDGGRGGDIVIRANHNSSTLSKYRTTSRWRAPAGGDGGTNKRHGRNGEDSILIVAPGTIVRHGDAIVADLVHDGDEAIVARGGRGGLGNTHFASSTHQAPRFAELGEPGEAFELTLELKLLADVGLVGLPNAGKSTLLSVISSARPKIADYPFTTLKPQLGVAQYHEHDFVVADIPGIIKGASQGKGLGDAFLKHIERTRVLLIMVDAASENAGETYKLLLKELNNYGDILSKRPRVVALSKSALATEDQLKVSRTSIAKAAKLKVGEIIILSAQEHQGLDQLMAKLVEVINTVQDEVIEPVSESIIEMSFEDVMDWYLEKTSDDTYTLKGKVADRWAARTNFGNEAAVERLHLILERAGVFKQLRQYGAEAHKTHLMMGTEEVEW
ncbi:MAG: GTPase ObgE [bacterium]